MITESNMIEVLIKDASIMELVKKMKPQDIAAVLTRKLGLQKHVAHRAADILTKHAMKKNEADVVISTGDSGRQSPKTKQAPSTWPYDALNTQFMNYWVRQAK